MPKICIAMLLLLAPALWAAGNLRTLPEVLNQTRAELADRGEIIGALTVGAGRTATHRIKLLTRSGRVRTINIPADPARPADPVLPEKEQDLESTAG